MDALFPEKYRWRINVGKIWNIVLVFHIFAQVTKLIFSIIPSLSGVSRPEPEHDHLLVILNIWRTSANTQSDSRSPLRTEGCCVGYLLHSVTRIPLIQVQVLEPGSVRPGANWGGLWIVLCRSVGEYTWRKKYFIYSLNHSFWHHSHRSSCFCSRSVCLSRSTFSLTCSSANRPAGVSVSAPCSQCCCSGLSQYTDVTHVDHQRNLTGLLLIFISIFIFIWSANVF